MVCEVNFLSSRKGSNPGGKCRVLEESVGLEAEFYLKYCYGPPIVPRSSFRGVHQPIYEAATYELARMVGLRTPECFILLNREKKVRFEGYTGHREKDPSGREFYFISRYLNCPENSLEDSHAISSVIVETESPYLESIHIADIKGKRQNYLLCNLNDRNVVQYVDLGCSFVHAVKGMLRLPTNSKIKNKREFNRMVKKLRKYTLIKADNTDFLPLDSFIDLLEGLKINTLNPLGRISLDFLVSKAELEEIKRDIVSSFSRSLRIFEERGLVIKS